MSRWNSSCARTSGFLLEGEWAILFRSTAFGSHFLCVPLSVAFFPIYFIVYVLRRGGEKSHALHRRFLRASRRESLRQIVQMCRSQGSDAGWSNILGEAARSLGVCPTDPPLPDLRDPEFFLDFFGQTLEYAAFPHKSKRHLALGSAIGAKEQARTWLCGHIAESAYCPDWIRRELIDLFRKNAPDSLCGAIP